MNLLLPTTPITSSPRFPIVDYWITLTHQVLINVILYLTCLQAQQVRSLGHLVVTPSGPRVELQTYPPLSGFLRSRQQAYPPLFYRRLGLAFFSLMYSGFLVSVIQCVLFFPVIVLFFLCYTLFFFVVILCLFFFYYTLFCSY